MLEEIGIATCRDLLHFYPRRYLDHTTVSKVVELRNDGEATTVVGTIVVAGEVQGARRPRYEAIMVDEWNGRMKLLWFQGLTWIKRAFAPGDRVAFHGKVQLFRGEWSMTHPEFDKLDEEGPQLSTMRILALYPGGAKFQAVGLTSKTFRRIIHHLIKTRGWDIPQVLPPWIVSGFDLMDGRVALRAIHFPKSQPELDKARERLKFEELFFLQLLLRRIQAKRQLRQGIRLHSGGPKLSQFLRDSLPFTLTNDQARALQDIVRDVAEGRQMHRLLQGDVGSGKTVLAMAALLMAVDSGYQGAFMAPTEVLVEQQYSSLKKYLGPIGVEVRLLAGRQRKKEREQILDELASGAAHIVVGTHAVIQDKVKFNRLAMAVIDEQHRFGVRQRGSLLAKGRNPHTLLMTATPIPRSLALTRYGDLDISLIKELPAGRKPIHTRLLSEKRRGEMVKLVRDELAKGHQVYVVYPQVEESEKTDLKDAERGFMEWKSQCADYAVGLVHGRMLSDAKEEVMLRFKAGELHVLVATTVIEVGVDTPNATVIVIEHSERFGLSQLHQMRGRVGRGQAQSYCVFMADYRQSTEARERLRVLLETTDGFKISDEDLRIRGHGEFFGTRQSGLPDLRIADIVDDTPIIENANKAVKQLAVRDPLFAAEEHKAMRHYFETFFVAQLEGFARAG